MICATAFYADEDVVVDLTAENFNSVSYFVVVVCHLREESVFLDECCKNKFEKK